ncbi:MAG: LacI family DNA-binding transcriptional regulator [Christensenellales bacterium]|jgi:LacI family transcriptional regulator
MSVTIKDIAAVAGVSHSTVSKALNNASSVNKQTRQRILELAKHMNYTPNLAARNLANKRNRSIGLVWPSAQGLFYYHLCATFQKAAARRDIDVFVSMSTPARALYNFRRYLMNYAVLWSEPSWQPDAQFAQERDRFQGQITIAGGGYCDGVNLLNIERAKGTFEAVRHLANLGHRRIAFVGEDTDKSAGYMRAVLEFSLDYSPGMMITAPEGFYYQSDTKRQELDQRFRALWRSKQRPTALVMDSQGSAFAMINTLINLDISIPEDLSVITYDDIPEFSIYPVALDTFGPSIETIVESILDDYERYYQNGEIQAKELQAIMPQFIRRESTKAL